MSFLVAAAIVQIFLATIVSASTPTTRYVGWNTFLSMSNILELSNISDHAEGATITVFSAGGALITSLAVTIDSGKQRDVIIHGLHPSMNESYGLIKVDSTDAVVGRMSFYLGEAGSSTFQFAFSQPLTNGEVGETVVPFNTYQPSPVPIDPFVPVANWLTVVNLSPTSTKQFTIERYDRVGVKLAESMIFVPAFGRLDVPSGHELGIETIGIARVIPQDGAAAYAAYVTRYGYSSGAGNHFEFAFPLSAQAPSGTEQWVSVSNGAGALNWLEIGNACGSTALVNVEVFTNGGTAVAPISISLSARAQEHVFVSALLPPGESGAVRFSSASNCIVVTSMFYHLDPEGRTESVYGLASKPPVDGSVVGSWNLYLEMYNWLRVFNTGATVANIQETVFRNGSPTVKNFQLLPHSGIDLGLHETNRYGTSRNAFGLVSVSGNALQTELLRLRPTTAGGIDFAFPISFTPGTVEAVGIWQPTPGTSWQWQLSGTIDTSFDVQMYDIDLENTPEPTIAALKASGKKVVCYFSAGTYENFRSDAASFPPAVIGSPLDDFPDERWLDIRRIDLLGPIMTARLDLAVTKGCDGVEPDNVDGYTNSSGFPLTAAHQLTYNRFIATEAHARGLSVGLKNDIDQIALLVDDFDWALNEQCFQFNECGGYSAFIAQDKAVFGVEYQGSTSSFCPAANAMNFDWLKKRLELDAERFSCR